MTPRPFRSLLLAIAIATVSAGLLTGACDSGANAKPAATSTGAPTASAVAAVAASHPPAAETAKTAAFHDQMRKLWEDHITWTRLFIVSASGGLPDLQATTDRLLQNQADIGDAVKPFYGEAAASQLTTLLKEHITTAGAILKAAKAGDTAAVTAASDRWYANADQVATLLNGANPNNWPLAEARAMMKEHLDLTLAEATAHLKGDYAADVGAYDKIHGQILGMADMLSAGIVAQFPDRFR